MTRRGCVFGAVTLGLALLLHPGSLIALESPAWNTGSEPIQVDSRSLEAQAGEGVVVFRGEVVARQGDLTLQADRLDVYIEPETRALQRVEAAGNVRIQKEATVATGEQATYQVAEGVVRLAGEAKVWRGRNLIAGDRITLYLAENRSVVEDAKAVFYPDEAEPGDDRAP